MKKSYFVFALVSLVVMSLGLMLGCGAASSGSDGGASSPQPWVYFGSNMTNRIYYIPPDSLTVAGSIELAPFTPKNFAPSPDGKKLYISTDSSNEIVVVDTGTNTISGLITLEDVSRSYGAIRVSSDGKILWLGSDQNNKLYKIHLPEGTVEVGVDIGSSPRGMAVSSDGSKLYLGTGISIEVRSTTYPFTILAAKYVGTSYICRDMAVKDGKVYAPLKNGSIGWCYVINMSDDSFTLITGEGIEYFGAVAIPGKNEVYISCNNIIGTIEIINTSTVVPTFEAAKISDGSNLTLPDYMAVTADGKYVCIMDVFAHVKIGYVDTDTKSIIDYSSVSVSDFYGNNSIAVIYK